MAYAKAIGPCPSPRFLVVAAKPTPWEARCGPSVRLSDQPKRFHWGGLLEYERLREF
jgi:hypothetical protein